MRSLKLFQWAAVLMLATALTPKIASAQEADTLSISGTFHSGGRVSINGFEYPGTIGADLAEVYANSNQNAWMLTLHGVSYSHDYYYADRNEPWGYAYEEQYNTFVDATSFDFQFFGPDADVLNEVVSQQLVGTFFELRNGYVDGSLFSDDNGPYAHWEIDLWPAGAGVSFNAAGWASEAQFSADEQGYPVVEPQVVAADNSIITDFRTGNSGGLVSFDDTVDIGSAGPPPALPPSLRINDATVREGDTGTVLAKFTVSLSAASIQAISVVYATGNGAATAGSDFQAVSNTLTFAPGETSKAVTVLVKGDRLAEPNETFVVNLSSPMNATIGDSQAVGTIVDNEPQVSISDFSKAEGQKGQSTVFTFTVTLSAIYDQPVTMSYRTVNGTATTNDSDYIAKSDTLTFAPGQTNKTITINVKGDSKKEPKETFYVDLFGNSGNSLFTKSRGIGSILNDD